MLCSRLSSAPYKPVRVGGKPNASIAAAGGALAGGADAFAAREIGVARAAGQEVRIGGAARIGQHRGPVRVPNRQNPFPVRGAQALRLGMVGGDRVRPVVVARVKVGEEARGV